MKTLKFAQSLAEKIRAGAVSSYWSMDENIDLSVNETVRLVEVVDPQRPETWITVDTARIISILEKRLADITVEELQEQGYASIGDMFTTLHPTNNNDVNLASVIKIINLELSQFQTVDSVIDTTNFAINDKKTTYKLEKVQLYTDGGSRGNPGPSASGFVVIDPTSLNVLIDRGIYLGITTNNQAEYLALKYGLEAVKEMRVRQVACYLDSMLVVNQMNGIFKVSNRDLWPVHESIKQLVKSFDKVTFTHVPRELNKLADAAVNRALDEGLGLAQA